MSLFDVNYEILAELNTPPYRRRPKILNFLAALVSPIQTDHDEFFNVFKPDIELRTKYNAQKIVFEAVLNSEFGVEIAPFIYIMNNFGGGNAVIVHNEAESIRSYVSFNESEANPVYFYNEAEILPEFDFTIYVPAALVPGSFTIDQVRALAEGIALVGTTFNIQTF